MTDYDPVLDSEEFESEEYPIVQYRLIPERITRPDMIVDFLHFMFEIMAMPESDESHFLNHPISKYYEKVQEP